MFITLQKGLDSTHMLISKPVLNQFIDIPSTTAPEQYRS